MKQLKYINSKGDVIDFRNYNTQIYKAGFHSYAWTYVGVERDYGVDIEKFTKEALTYEMSISARGTQKIKENVLNSIMEITEYDIVNNTQGKLIWGEHYLNCNLISATTEPSEDFAGAERIMGVLAPYPFWIQDLKKSFHPSSGGAGSPGDDLDYLYNYKYDYSQVSGGNVVWKTGHFAPSEFEIVIYGPIIDPYINIAGHPYGVYDTVEKGEYIIIDSKAPSVIKHRLNGTVKDLWDFRYKEKSTFEKIPGGDISVNWSGAFGFDITLHQERSEPRW